MSKCFNEKYKNIIIPVVEELTKLDNCINNVFSSEDIKKNEIVPIINDFLMQKGKMLRPALIFLFAKSLGLNIDNNIYNIAISTELLHNATLIHDDILDCSVIRRGKKTLNFQYDNKLAVLTGDYLLAKSIDILSDLENFKIQKLYSKTVENLINGELFQYFNRYKLMSINNYIEKSKNKTAKLFEAGIVSVCLNANSKEQITENARNFALNFGIAFQIHNDLLNLYNTEKISEDLKNGDYNAPIIFYALINNIKTIEKPNALLSELNNNVIIQKTKDLISKYMNQAIENISFIEDNLYKQSLVNLCKLYIEDWVSLDG